MPHPEVGPNEMADIDGNVYRTVNVASLRWMAENLRTGHYNDGTPIRRMNRHQGLEDNENGAFWVYDDNEQNDHAFGRLYNGHAVFTGKLCPEGWHVPTDVEWETLIRAMGGEHVAGSHLKSKSAVWSGLSGSVTDSIGFGALPGGVRGGGEKYSQVGAYGVWWTSTSYLDGMAWYFSLGAESDFMGAHYADFNHGFSCRCVQPIEMGPPTETVTVPIVSK